MDQELYSSWAAQVKELFPFKEVLWWRTYFVFFKKLSQRQRSWGIVSCVGMRRVYQTLYSFHHSPKKTTATFAELERIITREVNNLSCDVLGGFIIFKLIYKRLIYLSINHSHSPLTVYPLLFGFDID